MGFISEKLTRLGKWSRQDINELARAVSRILKMRIGDGLNLRNLPDMGMTLAIEKGNLGIPRWKFARIVSEGPNEAEDHSGSPAYWVREVKPTAWEVWDAKTGPVPEPSARRGMARSILKKSLAEGLMRWAVPTEWTFLKDGYWGPALNLAEIDLPADCRHFCLEPYYVAIPEDPDVDNTTPEGEITDSEDDRFLAGPIVKIWRHVNLEGYPFWAFTLLRPRLVEEWYLQTYDLDGDGCPDPTQWRRRVSIVLHGENGTP